MSEGKRECEACGYTRFVVDYLPAHMAGFLWRRSVPATLRVRCNGCGREFFVEPGSLKFKEPIS
jgi:hypothetical protein